MKRFLGDYFYIFRWIFAAAFIGIFSGLASHIFLMILGAVTEYRVANPIVLLLLPFCGVVIAFVYRVYGKNSGEGHKLILSEIQNPSEKHIPFRMAPLVMFATIATHLCGGSAGREGTAVQMGAAIADFPKRFFNLAADTRRVMLMSGVAAGFGSVFGTPMAGFVFALEFIAIGEIKYYAVLPVLLAPVVAHSMSTLLGTQHAVYAVTNELPIFDFKVIGLLLCAGAVFGLSAQLFSLSLEGVANFSKVKFKSESLRAFVGGLVVVALVMVFKLHDYAGLGLPYLQRSFTEILLIHVFFVKLVLTVLTLSAGFKGGEVTPLLFIGGTLGSALAAFFPLPVSLLAAAGFVSVFAGAANTPLACIVMAFELFGSKAAPYCAIAVVTSYFFSGLTGIYTAQIVKRNKFGIDSSSQSLPVDTFIRQTLSSLKDRFTGKGMIK